MMRCSVERQDRMGLVHPALDAHTLGVSAVRQLLVQCGIRCLVADPVLCASLGSPDEGRGTRLLRDWILGQGITVIGFSYRLDPEDGARSFGTFVERMRRSGLFASVGGPVKGVYFAGLPAACDRVVEQHPFVSGVFRGDETLLETLEILGVQARDLPDSLRSGSAYDASRMAFGRELVARGEYRRLAGIPRSYPRCGERGDRLVTRVRDGIERGLPPLMRAHVGPYLPDRIEAVKLFQDWTRRLAGSGLLDILSIGTSQLTQEAFGEDWGDRPNGGGVPLNSEAELAEIWDAARPMLVRSYAGTRDTARMATIHERTLDIAWHALSLWWFCRLDGRGPNPVRENLREHLATLRVIAASGKPFEPNVPHHFAFRGADDASYVLSGYLAARAAKEAGIRTLVLQVMLNTPKYTWGVQDLAKARVLLQMARRLEDSGFRILLQPRGGLDYFSRDEEKAKAQLAAVTAMMDDIEPEAPASPQIIHVVGYTEATRLADPAVVDESIRITRQALAEYRRMKRSGDLPDMRRHPEVEARTAALRAETEALLAAVEAAVPDPCSADGLYEVMAAGFFAMPYLWACREEFPAATAWETALVDGGIRVVDGSGKPVPARERAAMVSARLLHGR